MRLEKKIQALFIFFVVLLLLVVGKLFYLSCWQGKELAAIATEQKTKYLPLNQYQRGDFLDARGRKLTCTPAPCVVMLPDLITPPMVQLLGEVLAFPPAKIQQWVDAGRRQYNLPVLLKANLQQKEIADLNQLQLPGICVLQLNPRSTGLASHLLGVVAPAMGKQAAQGQSGLEQQYEQFLQGKLSRQIGFVVDAKGKLLTDQVIYGQDSQVNTGNDIYLTLNIDYQQFLEQALAGWEGAGVIMDVHNGDLLAVASSPSMDPYLMTAPATSDVYVNKAFAYYPPASTFKILMTAIALEEKIALPDAFLCTGDYKMENGRSIKCSKENGHGQVDLKKALANSCNAYFVDLGLRIGGDKIKQYVARWGLDHQKIIGYQLPNMKNMDFNSAVDGDVANVSIGENGIRLSPVMVAQLMSTAVNGGYQITPRLVQKIENSQKQVVRNFPTAPPQKVLSAHHSLLIKTMLLATVTEGTGKRAALAQVAAGGKTGTSQHQGVWFAGFLSGDQPQLAMVIYVAHGTAGGKEGADIFAQVAEKIIALENITK